MFCAVPAIGAARSTLSGKRTAHSQVCWAPMDPPTTRASRSTPYVSRSSCSWARTSSPMRTFGNRSAAIDSSSVVCGEVESPLPIWLTTTMKYFSGSSARPGPM